MMSGLSAETLEAYRETRYEVLGPPRFDLWIDRASDDLAELFQLMGQQSAAIITAFNPASERLSDDENALRHSRLLAELSSQGWMLLPSQNVDPGGFWPVELGAFVLGITVAEGIQLALQFGQSAIVFAGDDAVPRLVLTEPAIQES